MPACRSPIGCICRRSGPTTRPAARRRMFPRRSHLRPSRRSRSNRSARPVLRGSRAGSKRGAPEPRVSVKELALSLPKQAWRTITWREGSAASLRSRFARVRVRVAPIRGAVGRAEETLLIEWPAGEAEPTKYWLATLDQTISLRRLVDIAKMRWRIERDYQELKQEIGLGHYEGRGWPGFHHHGTLCIAAYGFLI